MSTPLLYHSSQLLTIARAVSVLTLIWGIGGCSGSSSVPADGTAAQSASAAVSPEGDSPAVTEPGVVNLKSVSAEKDAEQVVRFRVDYEFTSGAPVKTYLCNVRFPGTEHEGLKPLEAFELQPQGSFTMGIEVGETKVGAFEITLSEADSPDRGYTVISNTLTGQLTASAE